MAKSKPADRSATVYRLFDRVDPRRIAHTAIGGIGAGWTAMFMFLLLFYWVFSSSGITKNLTSDPDALVEFDKIAPELDVAEYRPLAGGH